MPSARDIALARYRRQQRLSNSLRAEARRIWRQVTPADVRSASTSWVVAKARLLTLLTAAQMAGARHAEGYVTAVLQAQGIDPGASGELVPGSLVGVASDGRPLETLLDSPVYTSRAAIGAGATELQAHTAGFVNLDLVLSTQATDAARVAVGIALTARRRAGGYVRMLAGASCSRCVVLAGRWYGWNAGFQRHPRLPLQLRPRAVAGGPRG